jgi:electron transfer flavoprotein alpha subunit
VPEAAELILGFLNGTKASLGSSKSLVDLSGEGAGGVAVHVASESSRADRRDAPASEGAFDVLSRGGTARGKADVLYVADAFEVIRRVNEELAAKQARGGSC